MVATLYPNANPSSGRFRKRSSHATGRGEHVSGRCEYLNYRVRGKGRGGRVGKVRGGHGRGGCVGDGGA